MKVMIPRPVCTTAPADLFPHTPADPPAKRDRDSTTPLQQPPRTQPAAVHDVGPTPSATGSASQPNTPSSLIATPGSATHSSFAARVEPKFIEALRIREPGAELCVEADVAEVAAEVALAVAALGKAAGESARNLMVHLKDPLNNGLREQVRLRTVTAARLVVMTDNELMNPELKRKASEGLEARNLERNLKHLQSQAAPASQLYKCPACGKRNCTIMQKQVRSGDEPMTVFCSCLECGRNFRRM
jgi:DNA-directed RNA polymerase subunit M/transcription elongation factor TFIIS